MSIIRNKNYRYCFGIKFCALLVTKWCAITLIFSVRSAKDLVNFVVDKRSQEEVVSQYGSEIILLQVETPEKPLDLKFVMFRDNIPKDDQGLPAEGSHKEIHGLGATEAHLVGSETLMMF